MSDYRKNLIESEDAIQALLADVHRVAVLGIKTEAQDDQAAFGVPRFLQRHGLEIVPVPVYYPDVTSILGQPVYRRLVDVPGQLDLVDVFRRPKDIDKHIDDIVAAHPRIVWFQLGIRNDDAARQFAEAGLKVVQDRCLMVEYLKFRGNQIQAASE